MITRKLPREQHLPVDLAAFDEAASARDGERSHVLWVDENRRGLEVGARRELTQQQGHRACGVPLAAGTGEQRVADVDCALLEPRALGVVVDPADDLAADDDARGRTRIV